MLTIKSKLRNFIAAIIYDAFDSIVLFYIKKNKNTQGSITIVFLELLGDYYLWLEYGLRVVDYYHSNGYKIKFVCNSSWYEIAKKHFPSTELFPIDSTAFLKSPIYRAKNLKELRLRAASSCTISPAYPRVSFGFVDSVIRAVGSNAVGHNSISTNRSALDKWRSDRWYSFLIQATPLIHQNERHAQLLKFLAVPKKIDKKELEPTNDCSYIKYINYFVIAPGCSDHFRQWPIEKFSEIGEYLLNRTDMTCIILGTQSDSKLGIRLEEKLSGRVINLVGKTSLYEFINLISKSKFVLSNDSSAAHIAESYHIPSINIVGGGNFGHCLPYPSSTTSNSVFKEMECFYCEWFCIYNLGKTSCYPCIDAVTVDMVSNKVDEVLSKLN